MKKNAEASQQAEASMEKVRQQFDGWRAKRGKRRIIPESLWKAAIELYPEYSICKIVKILRLSYSKLKSRILDASKEEAKENPAFTVEKKPEATASHKPQGSLEKVRQQFEDWRAKQGKRRIIPESLWRAAIELHPQCSICEIAKVLRLDYSKLKCRILDAMGKKPTRHPGFTVEKRPNEAPACAAGKKQKGPPAFIQFDIPARPPTQAEWSIEIEKTDGSKMKICSKSTQMPDFVEMCQNFVRAKS